MNKYEVCCAGLGNEIWRTLQLSKYKRKLSDFNICPEYFKYYWFFEKKNLNIHRIICCIELKYSEINIVEKLIDFRKYIYDKSGGKFYRGLGLGMILCSSRQLDENDIKKVVYSKYSGLSITVFQWIFNVCYERIEKYFLVHTYTPVYTSPIIKLVFDYLNIDENDRKITITEPIELFKVDLLGLFKK